MDSVVGNNPFSDRRRAERRRLAYPPVQRALTDGLRVSWGGIWGGVLVVMGMLMLLSALGVAIGLSTVDPSAATDAGKLMTGAGIYAVVSLLVSLFVGGMVSTRIGAVYDRTTSLFAGALVWIVSVLAMLVLAGSGLGLMEGMSFDLSEAPAAAWMGFGALAVSLLTSILGAMSGTRQPTSIGT